MKNICIFASGNGTNFEAIVDAVNNGIIENAKVVMLIVDRKNAYAILRAKRLNIEYRYVNATKFNSREDYEREIVNIISPLNIDLICLAGYMKIITNVLLDAYKDKIINIHPALLPSFKGAHGINDAFNFGCKVFGVTIHHVSSELDGGKIIAQKAIEYYGNDVLELEGKIHDIEHVLYPDVVNKLLKGELKWEER